MALYSQYTNMIINFLSSIFIILAYIYNLTYLSTWKTKDITIRNEKSLTPIFFGFTYPTRTYVFKYLNNVLVFAAYCHIDKIRCDIAAYSARLSRKDYYHGLQSDMSLNLGIHYFISAKVIP